VEEWIEIDEFPEYSVSTFGRISNNTHKRILTRALNNRGIPTVGLYDGPRQYRRAVPVLVADAWVSNLFGEHFNTPTHLNGDRQDCHADNLVWRPRWFAIRYHQEILIDMFPDWHNAPFELLQTEEVFQKPLPCAEKYGLLQMDIFLGMLNKRPVFPGGLEFRKL